MGWEFIGGVLDSGVFVLGLVIRAVLLVVGFDI